MHETPDLCNVFRSFHILILKFYYRSPDSALEPVNIKKAFNLFHHFTFMF